MYSLTSEQVSKLLQAHCYRVINKMSREDLVSYACQMMSMSFNKDSDYSPDVVMLISDIRDAENEDLDSVSEFIAGVLGNEASDYIMTHYQF